MKLTITTKSTNHVGLLALHKASREVVWLRTMEIVLAKQCKIELGSKPTILCKDNVVCINQMTSIFIKADRIKHISPYLFGYTQDLTEYGLINVRKIESFHKNVDMLTKALPTYKHKTLVYDAGMRSLQELIPS